MSSPPVPPGMSETKYSHLPSGDTAGWAYDESVSAVMVTFCGLLHVASDREEE